MLLCKKVNIFIHERKNVFGGYAMNYGGKTISELRIALVEKWEISKEEFAALRDSCNTATFDGAMAILLGGASSTSLAGKTYANIVSKSGDTSPWRANAGLRPNTISGNQKYSTRGFFEYPHIKNAHIEVYFPETMTIEDVCNKVKGYSDDYFRVYRKNPNSTPREDFEKVVNLIAEYAFSK